MLRNVVEIVLIVGLVALCIAFAVFTRFYWYERMRVLDKQRAERKRKTKLKRP
jgi:uncharacterized protein (DUF2062 family)